MPERTLFALLLMGFSFGCDSGGGAADAAVPGDAPMPDAARPDAHMYDAGSNAGFVVPTAVTHAWQKTQSGDWEDQGPADFSCLNAPTELELPGQTSLSVTTLDFQTGNIVPNAAVSAFGDGDLGSPPLASVTSDESGEAAMTLPAGTRRTTFLVTATGQMDSVWVDALETTASPQTVEVSSVSELTANALPAFVGVTRTRGLALSMGMVRDCQDRPVSDAAVAMSATAGAPDHLGQSSTYYFSAGSTSLPVRHNQQATTNSDGLFMIIESPVTATAYIQAWGFVDGQVPGTDDPVLLSEYRLALLADTFTGPYMRPGEHH